MSKEVTKTGGIGLCGAMFLIFMTLKLTGYISWSWGWVTAPLWGPFVLVFVVVLICGLIALYTSSKQ